MDTTLQYIPILIVGFATSLGLTPLTRQIAMRLGVVDKPNVPRKTHKDHKPMMGGLAIYLALSLSVLMFSPSQHIRELLLIVFGAGVLALVGALDDRYNLSWRLRFGVQFLVAGLLVLSIQGNMCVCVLCLSSRCTARLPPRWCSASRAPSVCVRACVRACLCVLFCS